MSFEKKDPSIGAESRAIVEKTKKSDLMNKWVSVLQSVNENQYAMKKLDVNETVAGIIIEGVITNSITYKDNFQIMLKVCNIYKHYPPGVPEGSPIADEEFMYEERREIIYCPKSACTQILHAINVPEPEGGYDLKALADRDVTEMVKKSTKKSTKSAKKSVCDPLKNRKYTLKYLGLKKSAISGNDFHSFTFQLL